MRLFLLLMALTAALPVRAKSPPERLEFPVIEGTVEHAVWRSAFQYDRLASPDLEDLGLTKEPNVQTVSMPEHWTIVLSDVKGMDAETCERVRWACERHKGGDAFSTIISSGMAAEKKEKAGALPVVLLMVPGGKEQGIEAGDKVKLRKAVIHLTAFYVHLEVLAVEIVKAGKDGRK